MVGDELRRFRDTAIYPADRAGSCTLTSPSAISICHCVGKATGSARGDSDPAGPRLHVTDHDHDRSRHLAWNLHEFPIVVARYRLAASGGVNACYIHADHLVASQK
jgi:hypothetical protein